MWWLLLPLLFTTQLKMQKCHFRQCFFQTVEGSIHIPLQIFSKLVMTLLNSLRSQCLVMCCKGHDAVGFNVLSNDQQPFDWDMRFWDILWLHKVPVTHYSSQHLVSHTLQTMFKWDWGRKEEAERRPLSCSLPGTLWNWLCNTSFQLNSLRNTEQW